MLQRETGKGELRRHKNREQQATEKKFYAESKISLALPTSGGGSDLSGAAMAAPLVADRDHTHQHIAYNSIRLVVVAT